MRFLRYPGGKGKLLSFLVNYLPNSESFTGRYIEPFVGGGSVFLHLRPKSATIADLNNELIELYRGIRNYPKKVWDEFKNFPSGKRAYYKIRDVEYLHKPIYQRAARTLFLNRTCFKGMWRHGSKGNFNVGYGGEERRWAITLDNLKDLSEIFKAAEIHKADFEKTLSAVRKGDFVFIDPPYKPGEIELKAAHYNYGKFSFEDQKRLATTLITLSEKKDFKWLMTNTNNKKVKELYKDFTIRKVPLGTGYKPGIFVKNPREILISNY